MKENKSPLWVRILYEVIKAVLYALVGYFGGETLL